jgi:hypothetical protein
MDLTETLGNLMVLGEHGCLCEETARFIIGIGLKRLHASDKVEDISGTQRMQYFGIYL